MANRLSDNVLVKQLAMVRDGRADDLYPEDLTALYHLDLINGYEDRPAELRPEGREVLARCGDAPEPVRKRGISTWHMAEFDVETDSSPTAIVQDAEVGLYAQEHYCDATDLRALATCCNAAAAELEARDAEKEDADAPTG